MGVREIRSVIEITSTIGFENETRNGIGIDSGTGIETKRKVKGQVRGQGQGQSLENYQTHPEVFCDLLAPILLEQHFYCSPYQ
ncbi:hypothetical protein EVAR_72323_1 [Eumeta japonica]|uniref:Uncharacterized protein n=1 Tax=Eumeta variegata TaxID=151549 RepID=A0A4C1SEW3_EUMVA|nr:hypothetical protein EVAR_72323_1 [Eumeta japonica]